MNMDKSPPNTSLAYEGASDNSNIYFLTFYYLLEVEQSFLQLQIYQRRRCFRSSHSLPNPHLIKATGKNPCSLSSSQLLTNQLLCLPYLSTTQLPFTLNLPFRIPSLLTLLQSYSSCRTKEKSRRKREKRE